MQIPGSIHTALRNQVLRRFHRMFYSRAQQTWQNTRWRGTRVLKNPFDLWVYQEMIYELQPELIVETGTADGGSALYLASLLDLNGHGRLMTIDIDRKDFTDHSRIEYLTASSVAAETIDHVRAACDAAGVVLVILDADHSYDHVLAELRAYADLVTVGSYIIVEDSNVNGHPVARSFGPGPMEALREFLASDNRFVVDTSREKYMLTFNPSGYLRRVGE